MSDDLARKVVADAWARWRTEVDASRVAAFEAWLDRVEQGITSGYGYPVVERDPAFADGGPVGKRSRAARAWSAVGKP